jgi:DNA-binding LacI/PurR family transcriptional regulator
VGGGGHLDRAADAFEGERALRQRRSGADGLLGAEDALGIGEMSVFMCDTRDDPERERRYVEMLAARGSTG